ncbi:MAG: flagellar motor protein MotB [Planctomycetota bacterium]
MAQKDDEDSVGQVPAYMVSFGDMITLLLTFFILLVALADTQQAGLVGAGRGPLIRHINAKGEPGIMDGRLIERQQQYKHDSWWIPDQEGDPDQLEVVREKLQKELVTRFKPHEARITYEKDRLVLRLPAKIEFDAQGRPMINQAMRDVLRTVARAGHRQSDRYIRINGEVAPGSSRHREWLDSAQLSELVYMNLLWNGMSAKRMSIWGWGASRSMTGGAAIDRGVTIEVIDVPDSVTADEL